MFEYDPVKSLQHHPTPVRKYGLNPYAEPLYRIVVTQTRMHLVGGTWTTKCQTCEGIGAIGSACCPTCQGAGCGAYETGYHWVPMYREVRAGWILERWRPEPMTKRQWDRDLVDPASGWLLLGPYPSRGDYELCWEFDAGVDNDSLDSIIAFVEQKRLRDWNVAPDRVRADYDADQRETKADNFMEMREAMTAFGSAPISYGRHGRGTKTAAQIITAEQAGLPVPRALPAGRGSRIGPMEISSSIVAGA